MGRLDGKVCLVTGAAQGQGLVESQLFAAEGAVVYMTDVVKPLEPPPPDARFMLHDVTSESDWQRVVSAIEAESGQLDVLGEIAALPLQPPADLRAQTM